MIYNLSAQFINSINFNELFSSYNDLTNDFFDSPGRQHYKLLSYFSTFFNNVNIIDIGTHMGESALALSFNNNNTIYTFDIVDKGISKKKEKSNINFVIEDILTDKNGREKWKDIILSSPFIFLDVDPHNGHMEYDFYLFLKENNYNGFVICDDIWYFKDMRDNFWYKIEDNYKYDISEYGHWSGTGVFTFNKDIIFSKYDNSNWTLVTAYFNLTKCPDASDEIIQRDKNYYLSHSISTLSLPYNLVIYCDEESYAEIIKIRPEYLRNKTKYIIRDFDYLKFNQNDNFGNVTFSQYRDIINHNRKDNPYYFDKRNTASYYLFCMSRYIMMKEIINLDPFGSTHFCWINFCIERMGYKNVKYLDEALSIKRDKFSTCYIDYIPHELINNTKEYYKWGRCGMCSGFFTGNKEYMYKVCDLIEKKFIYYLIRGYGHADEQLYSPVYFENPELFEHYYGDYQQMITNYAYIYEAPEAPIRNFIRNSYENKNYKKCFEACNYLLKSYHLDKFQLDNENFNRLKWYYDRSLEELSKLNNAKNNFDDIVNENSKLNLAFYTCYFGGNVSFSKLIPPIPSEKYDCYYFTNNIEIYNSLENTKWIRVYLENIKIHSSDIDNTKETKELRTCSHKFDLLNKYEYLCWFDNKLKVYDNIVEKIVAKLSQNENIFIAFTKHPYSNIYSSVWNEFNLAMNTERYFKEKNKNIQYIQKKLNQGFSEKIDVFYCGGFQVKKKCEKMMEFGDLWYSNILECGIEDQISLQFIEQKYSKNILPLEYDKTIWKYFYE